MSQKSNRPQHDRSKRIKDSENNTIIQLIEREDGVVSKHFRCQYQLIIRGEGGGGV